MQRHKQASTDPMAYTEPQNIQNTTICCGFFQTGFHSFDRRQYSGSLLRYLSSHNSTLTMGWAVLGSNPSRDNGFSPLLNHPAHLQHPPKLWFNGHQGSGQWGGSNWNVKLTNHLHLMLRLRKNGAVPLFPLHTFMTQTGATLTFLLWDLCTFTNNYMRTVIIETQGAHDQLSTLPSS